MRRHTTAGSVLSTSFCTWRSMSCKSRTDSGTGLANAAGRAWALTAGGSAPIQRGRMQDDWGGRSRADEMHVVAVDGAQHRQHVEHALAEQRTVQVQRQKRGLLIDAEIARFRGARRGCGFAEAADVEHPHV